MTDSSLLRPLTITIPVRITDVNYGAHVGNDAWVSLIHEARVQYLQALGFAENHFGAYKLILSRLEVKYKQQVFYPDHLSVTVATCAIKSCSFNLVYHVKNQHDQVVLQAVTEMVCFDYEHNKIRRLPASFVETVNRD